MKWDVTVARVGTFRVEANSQVEAITIVNEDVETKDIEWADRWVALSADKVIDNDDV